MVADVAPITDEELARLEASNDEAMGNDPRKGSTP